MIYLVAILAGFGGAYIGWELGLTFYAAVFEVLRHYDLDAIIDSRDTLAVVRRTFGVLGFGAGLWLMWYWRPADMAAPGAGPSAMRTLAIGTLAGAGGAVAANLVDIGGLFIQVFGIGKDAYILIMLGASFVMLLLGVALAVRVYGKSQSLAAFAGRTLVALAGAMTLIVCGLAFDKAVSSPYGTDWPRRMRVEIRFPATVPAPPQKETIRVELRTDKGREDGYPSEWLRNGDRFALRASFDLVARTRERMIVVFVPGEPERHFRMRFPSNPKPSHGYGPWHRVDGIAAPGQAQPSAPGKDDDFDIRYMIF